MYVFPSQLGREEPAMSMDVSGKMVFARHSELQQANLRVSHAAIGIYGDISFEKKKCMKLF